MTVEEVRSSKTVPEIPEDAREEVAPDDGDVSGLGDAGVRAIEAQRKLTEIAHEVFKARAGIKLVTLAMVGIIVFGVLRWNDAEIVHMVIDKLGTIVTLVLGYLFARHERGSK